MFKKLPPPTSEQLNNLTDFFREYITRVDTLTEGPSSLSSSQRRTLGRITCQVLAQATEQPLGEPLPVLCKAVDVHDRLMKDKHLAKMTTAIRGLLVHVTEAQKLSKTVVYESLAEAARTTPTADDSTTLWQRWLTTIDTITERSLLHGTTSSQAPTSTNEHPVTPNTIDAYFKNSDGSGLYCEEKLLA